MRPRLREELGFAPSSFVLGSVGRLVAIKDHGTLLRAASLLAGRGLDVRVLLAGAGPEMDALQKQANGDDRLSGRVLFLGASNRIQEFLNAMDVFVLPSLGEGMSNTTLEAMATGLPVVATRVGGNPELIEEGRTGFLFSPRDVLGLSEVLEHRLRDDVVRQQIGTAARQRAVARFSLDKMVAEYRDMYVTFAKRHQLVAEPEN
jgi:glycosyltransferase involved in cell wall biosynthesis